MSAGQFTTSGGGGRNAIEAGPLTIGYQGPAAPLSEISVKTSKKLLMRNSAGNCRTLVRPSEALVGLSRTITPPGSVPPDMLKESISVLKNRVLPEFCELITCTLIVAGAENGWKLAPPSTEIKPLTCEPKFSVWPPPPGGSQTENFGSQVNGLISVDGGASFQPFSAPATISVQVISSQNSGNTRFFNTEMLSLSMSGGTLPGGVMVRESPTRSSLGRTSVRQLPAEFRINSFFDVFTEISLNGAAGPWYPMVSGPASMALRPPPPLVVNCPADIAVTTPDPAGAVVTYTSSSSGGCPPVSVSCNPPSGSTFPVGTTTVTCSGFDACGQTATCSFKITVIHSPGDPCLAPDNGSGTVTLPPAGCQ